MALKIPSTLLPRSLPIPPRQNPNLSHFSTVSNRHLPLHFFTPSTLSISAFHGTRLLTARAIQGQELTGDDLSIPADHEEELEKEETLAKNTEKKLAEQGIWIQMQEIIKFTGPATGLWLCGPLMSLIDTAVIGQGSSIELAALGIQLFMIFLVYLCKFSP